jgi:2-iminobutanoate/2-iminopropanoate deaminase
MTTSKRCSINVPILDHGDLPIPTVSRVGPLIATGGVRGVNPRTGVMPIEVCDQAQFMFDNLRAIVQAAGGKCEDIVKITIWIAVPEARAAINEAWTKYFPDASSRPARHILNYALSGGMLVQCDALAYVSG